MFKRLREMQILQRLRRVPIVKPIFALLLVLMVCSSIIYHAYLPTLITNPSGSTLSPEVPDELFLKLCAKKLIDQEQSFTIDVNRTAIVWRHITPYEIKASLTATGWDRSYGHREGEASFTCLFYYTNQGWVPVETGESTGALLKDVALAKSARLEAGKK